MYKVHTNNLSKVYYCDVEDPDAGLLASADPLRKMDLRVLGLDPPHTRKCGLELDARWRRSLRSCPTRTARPSPPTTKRS